MQYSGHQGTSNIRDTDIIRYVGSRENRTLGVIICIIFQIYHVLSGFPTIILEGAKSTQKYQKMYKIKKKLPSHPKILK